MEFDLSKRQNYWFNEISRIPRGSRNEKAVSDFVVSFAKEHGLSCKQDHVWNVIVDKPASPGCEDAPVLMMQAHMDVVCEKNKDTVHDFTKDPLDLYVDEEGWLHARGTTLGSDDGYGCAYMLAVLEDDSLKHPALQCIFTTMEEIGLLGAFELKKEDLHGRRLINLDGGGVNNTCVSSAGGARAQITAEIEYEENTDPVWVLGVRGLQGGHSGGCIHLERGNSNILAARILKEAQLKGLDIRLVSFTGGLKFNAIPREADVVFASSSPYEKLMESFRKSEAEICEELRGSDSFFITVEESASDKKIVRSVSDNVLNYLFLMPNGFQHKSMTVKDLTASSLNVGAVVTEDGKIIMEDLIRSAIASHTDVLIEHLQTLGQLLNISVNIHDRYYGWAFREESPLRSKLESVLNAHGLNMECHAAHGGLECGVFAGMDKEMDIITFGPIATGEHTPDEKLNLESFDFCYGLLRELISSCC